MSAGSIEELKPNQFEKYCRLTPDARAKKVNMAAREPAEAPASRPAQLAQKALKRSKEQIDVLRELVGTTYETKNDWPYFCLVLVNLALKRILVGGDGVAATSSLLRFGRDCFSEIQTSGDRREVLSAKLRHDLFDSPLLEYLEAFITEFERSSGYRANGAGLLSTVVADSELEVLPNAQKLVEDVFASFYECFAKDPEEAYSSDTVEALLREGALWSVKELVEERNDRRPPPVAEGGDNHGGQEPPR
eukprot:CAMPEP_0173422138 /NCGR_PEP_ID=MMETSP1357-20121228/2956_1 /TAXON_ID=77926 /ORGANISM="Hemiselmis rufescens, Strain PCC563" /LENGTH=247 /DNA_ID=CAMNT_0014385123 /DNA_START=59 /DNA_END=798 /DNA_ORIENTATION=+